MYGVVTRNEGEVGWSDFDGAFYEVKDVTGRAADPVEGSVSMVSCFGDNHAAESSPELVPVSADGDRATRERPYFDWDYVCPNATEYREGLLRTVAEVAAVTPDVRLDDVGFPRAEYCHCERCEAAFAASDYEDREPWRAAVITEFVADAADRVPGRTYLTLYPDPYPGHLRRRAGLDVAALAPHVDEFVVPLYDTAYGTTYWLETIASGFETLLSTEADGAPLSVELYAVNVDVDALVHATEVAESVADHVYFGYDASTAAAALRRMRADREEGAEFHPGDGRE
jgi:hypothetical protein